jgi:hypothetical protein
MTLTRVVLIFLLVTAGARGASSPGSDVSLKFGTASGSLTQTNPDATKSVYQFGGIPLNISLNTAQSDGFYMYFGLGIIADITNFQVTRAGFHTGLVFHLLGGSRIIRKDYGALETEVRNPSNLSFGLRFSFNHYEAATVDGLAKISQSVLETAGGLEYRFDVSEKVSWSFEIYTGLMALGVGNSSVTPSLMEFWISYRIFL